MKIIYLSRLAACDTPASPNWVVISITCPKDRPAKLADGWRDILRLEFHDIVSYAADVSGTLVAFRVSQAEAILNFMEKHKDAAGVLIHCEAGVSRSGAVAKFLAEKYGVEEVLGLCDYQCPPEQIRQYNSMVHEMLWWRDHRKKNHAEHACCKFCLKEQMRKTQTSNNTPVPTPESPS